MPKGNAVATGTIDYASLDPVIGGAVTFTTTTDGLKGGQYPMVYLACVTSVGRTVYGQLDQPDATFILGGGASPWIDPNDPDYHADVTCTGYLYAYPNVHKTEAAVLLDTADPFTVTP